MEIFRVMKNNNSNDFDRKGFSHRKKVKRKSHQNSTKMHKEVRKPIFSAPAARTTNIGSKNSHFKRIFCGERWSNAFKNTARDRGYSTADMRPIRVFRKNSGKSDERDGFGEA